MLGNKAKSYETLGGEGLIPGLLQQGAQSGFPICG